MRFVSLTGKPITKSVNKFTVDWVAPSRSKFQKSVKDILRPYWKTHAVFEEFPVFGSRYTLDFLNLTSKVAVEVQGEGHTKFVPFFHRNRVDFLSQIQRDQEKARFCEMNGWELVEIFSEDKKDLENKVIDILGL